MKRIFSILFALVLVLSFSLIPAVPAAAQSTIHVPSDYSTIQAAVDAASPGDTIIVHAGVYNEAVTIGKDDITLKGEDGAILDGDGLGNVIAVTIQADGVTIQNFEVRDYGNHAIRADRQSGITLRHLNIHDVGLLPGGHNHAIDIRGGTDVIIQNVRVAVGPPAPDWVEAIRLQSIDGVQVINVDVNGGRNGVNFALGDDPNEPTGPTNGVIKDSTFANNERFAVFIANSENAIVKGNKVEDAGWFGIYAGWAGAEVTGVLIQGNEVSGTGIHGITLAGASDSVVRGNDVSGSGGDGIALYSLFWATDNNLVQGNEVSYSGRYGISVTRGATDNLIRGNTVSNSGVYDLYDDETGDNTWKGNTGTSDPDPLP